MWKSLGKLLGLVHAVTEGLTGCLSITKVAIFVKGDWTGLWAKTKNYLTLPKYNYKICTRDWSKKFQTEPEIIW